MAFRYHLLLALGLLALVLASCDELRGPGGGGAHQTSQVTVSVRPAGAAALVNGLAGSGTAQFGTSLVVLVATGTAPPADQNALAAASVYDRDLLDLATGTVTLTMPLGVSVQLFEYTFNDILTLAEITGGSEIGGTPNQSAPFTLATEATELTVSLPLAPSSLREGFTGALDPALWKGTGAINSSGGRLQLSASEVYDAAATDAERATGDRAAIRSNRNILLNSHRVAGTLAVQSFGATDIIGGSTPAAQTRAQVRLHYQPRDSRGDSTLLTVVRLNFIGTAAGTYFVRLDAGTCLAAICAGPSGVSEGFDAAHQKLIPLPLGFPTPNLPFSLQYIGGNVFRGTVNGVSRTLDISALSNFNANDFREVELRAQGRFAYESGDIAAIRAIFTNVEVGDDGTAGNDGGALATTPFVYAANAGTADVSKFRLDSTSGALTALGAPVAGLSGVGGGTADPTGRFLYVAAVNAGLGILAERVDSATGTLTSITGSPYGGLSFDVATDPLGVHLYSAGDTDNVIRFYSIGQTTGALTPLGTRNTTSRPLGVVVDNTGRFVYAADFSASLIFEYSRNSTTGAITQIRPAFSVGSQPLDMAAHPDQPFIYVSIFGASRVTALRIDTGTGALTAVGSFTTGTTPWGVRVHPSGKYLYVSSQTNRTISVFAINTATGALTELPGSPFPMTATGQIDAISMDPAGLFLFLSSTNGTVSVFAINQSTGVPSEVPGSPTTTGGTITQAVFAGGVLQ